MNWEIGIDMYTLMCIKQITNKNLLYIKKYIYIPAGHSLGIIWQTDSKIHMEM